MGKIHLSENSKGINDMYNIAHPFLRVDEGVEFRYVSVPMDCF